MSNNREGNDERREQVSPKPHVQAETPPDHTEAGERGEWLYNRPHEDTTLFVALLDEFAGWWDNLPHWAPWQRDEAEVLPGNRIALERGVGHGPKTSVAKLHGMLTSRLQRDGAHVDVQRLDEAFDAVRACADEFDDFCRELGYQRWNYGDQEAVASVPKTALPEDQWQAEATRILEGLHDARQLALAQRLLPHNDKAIADATDVDRAWLYETRAQGSSDTYSDEDWGHAAIWLACQFSKKRYRPHEEARRAIEDALLHADIRARHKDPSDVDHVIAQAFGEKALPFAPMNRSHVIYHRNHYKNVVNDIRGLAEQELLASRRRDAHQGDAQTPAAHSAQLIAAEGEVRQPQSTGTPTVNVQVNVEARQNALAVAQSNAAILAGSPHESAPDPRDDAREGALVVVDVPGASNGGREDPPTDGNFSFRRGQAFFGETQLNVGTGAALDILDLLATRHGKVVPFKDLDSYSKKREASEKIRDAVRTIRQAFRTAKVPHHVKNYKAEGYALQEGRGE